MLLSLMLLLNHTVRRPMSLLKDSVSCCKNSHLDDHQDNVQQTADYFQLPIFRLLKKKTANESSECSCCMEERFGASLSCSGNFCQSVGMLIILEPLWYFLFLFFLSLLGINLLKLRRVFAPKNTQQCRVLRQKYAAMQYTRINNGICR